MSLRFKVGDLAILVSSKIPADPDIGSVVEIVEVGPWKAGESDPLGEIQESDTDYLIKTASGIWGVCDDYLKPLPGDSDFIHSDTRALFTKRQRNPDDLPAPKTVKAHG